MYIIAMHMVDGKAGVVERDNSIAFASLEVQHSHKVKAAVGQARDCLCSHHARRRLLCRIIATACE
jgi:hypothetical protein